MGKVVIKVVIKVDTVKEDNKVVTIMNNVSNTMGCIYGESILPTGKVHQREHSVVVGVVEDLIKDMAENFISPIIYTTLTITTIYNFTTISNVSFFD